MDADEILPLTREAIIGLLVSRQESDAQDGDPGNRGKPRWAFPGAVEMWVTDSTGLETHLLGVCQNLSEGGVGVRCDEELEVGATLPIAVHQPEASFHGRGIVRHCTPRGQSLLVGIEFIFDDA